MNAKDTSLKALLDITAVTSNEVAKLNEKKKNRKPYTPYKPDYISTDGWKEGNNPWNSLSDYQKNKEPENLGDQGGYENEEDSEYEYIDDSQDYWERHPEQRSNWYSQEEEDEDSVLTNNFVINKDFIEDDERVITGKKDYNYESIEKSDQHGPNAEEDNYYVNETNNDLEYQADNSSSTAASNSKLINVILVIAVHQDEEKLIKPYDHSTNTVPKQDPAIANTKQELLAQTKGWIIVVAESMTDGYNKIKKVIGNKKIDHFILDTHGTGDSGYMVLSNKHWDPPHKYLDGGWGVEYDRIKGYADDPNNSNDKIANEQLSGLDNIGTLIKSSGTAVILSCGFARGKKGDEALKEIGNIWENRFTVYASGSFNSQPFIIQRANIQKNNKLQVISVLTYHENPLIIFNKPIPYRGVNLNNTFPNGYKKLVNKKIIDYGKGKGNLIIRGIGGPPVEIK